MGPVRVLPHTSRLLTGSTAGIGFTVITIGKGVPEHAFENGMTVIIVEIGPLEELVAIKEGILPDPVVDARPTPGLLLVQLYTVFGIVEPVKIIGSVERFVHNSCEGTGDTVGLGRMLMEKLMLVPEQLFETGVTVIKPVMGILYRFVALNAGMEPLPNKGNPISELVFVQLKTVPGTITLPLAVVPMKLMGRIVCVPQIAISATGATDGIGFTCIVNCIGVPEHPFVKGTTVISELIGILERFVEVNPAIDPIPLVLAIPVPVLELVQL